MDDGAYGVYTRATKRGGLAAAAALAAVALAVSVVAVVVSTVRVGGRAEGLYYTPFPPPLRNLTVPYRRRRRWQPPSDG